MSSCETCYFSLPYLQLLLKQEEKDEEERLKSVWEEGKMTHKWYCIWKWKGSRCTDHNRESYGFCEEGTIKPYGYLSSEQIKVRLGRNPWAWIE